MNHIKQLSIYIGLSLISFSTISCASKPDVAYMKYTTNQYNPSNNVDVLHTYPNDRKYNELGKLSIKLKKSIREDAVLYMKDKAKSIGADAIVIIGERNEGSVMVPVGKYYVKVDKIYLDAIAIKYEP